MEEALTEPGDIAPDTQDWLVDTPVPTEKEETDVVEKVGQVEPSLNVKKEIIQAKDEVKKGEKVKKEPSKTARKTTSGEKKKTRKTTTRKTVKKKEIKEEKNE